jgi:ATP-dependent Clp protease protease subunit
MDTIYLSGPINGGTAEGICKQIIEYNIKGEVNHIQMIINSPGGSCPADFQQSLINQRGNRSA